MRKLFFSSILMLVPLCSLFAQTNDAEFEIFRAKPQVTVGKTSGNSVSWLMAVGEGERTTTGTYDNTLDTTTYAYLPGFHNWNNIQNDWAFADQTRSGYNKTAAQWMPVSRTLKTYNSAGQLEKQEVQLRKNGAWLPMEEQTFTYANGLIFTWVTRTFDTTDNAWQNEDSSEQYYDSKNRIVKRIGWSCAPNASTWYLAARDTTIYNSDSIDLVNIYVFKNGTWVLNNSVDYIYAGGKLIERNIVPGPQQPQGENRYVYGYNSAGQMIQYTWLMPSGSSGYKYDSSIRRYHYDAAGNIDTISHYVPYVLGTTRIQAKYMYSYNSYGQLTSAKGSYYSDADKKWSVPPSERRWHYGFYNVSVPQAASARGSLDIFPVPASTQLSVDVRNTSAHQLSLTISGIDGRLIRSWTQPVEDGHYAEKLDISFLSPGSYIITVHSPAGEMSKRFNVVR